MVTAAKGRYRWIRRGNSSVGKRNNTYVCVKRTICYTLYIKKINLKWIVSSLIILVFLPIIFLIFRIYTFIHKLSEQLGSSMIWPIFFVATFVISIFLIVYLISLILIIKNKPAGYLVSGITATFMSVILIIGVLMYSSSIFSNVSAMLGIIVNFVLLITICVTSFWTYVKIPKQISSLSEKQKVLNVLYIVIVIVVILFAIFFTIQSSFRTNFQRVNKENTSVTSLGDNNLSKEDYIKQLVSFSKSVVKFPITIVDKPDGKVVWVDISAESSAVHIDYSVSGSIFNNTLNNDDFVKYIKSTTCKGQSSILNKNINIDMVVFNINSQQKYNVYMTKEDCLIK